MDCTQEACQDTWSENGNIHVQTNKGDCQPELGNRSMVSGGKQLYTELQQATMKSWIDKTQIMTMLTQTQDNHMINPIDCKEMLTPRIKLQQQWKQRNRAILEQADIRKQETKEKRHRPHAKKTTQKELIQYIAAHPSMPEEMELNREGRKQLAELMPE